MQIGQEVLGLIGCQKAEFNHAAMLRSRVLKFQTGVALLAGASAFFGSALVLYLLSIAALILSALSFYWSQQLAFSRSHAERLRRTTMLIGGLGFHLSGAELLELCRDGSAPATEAKRLIDPDYFASQRPAGPERMVEMLEESAIWTTNLAKFAARETWALFGGIAFSLVLVLLGAAAFASPSEWQLAARIVMVILVSLLSADFFGAAVSYSGARRGVQRVIDRLQMHKAEGTSLDHVMLIFGDYNSIVESMPPFPTGLYPRHQKQLNEDYKMFLTGPQ